MPHLTLYDQLGDIYAYLERNSWAGRGSEPVGRRGPESSPKVSPMTRGTCGALGSKWILPKK